LSGKYVALLVLAGALVLGLGALTACVPVQDPPDPVPTKTTTAPTSSPTSSPTLEPAPAPVFDRSALSIDDPNSIWVVSNKLRPLQPLDFAPADLSMPEGVDNQYSQPLRAPAARAAEALIGAAAAAGHDVWIISAYRDFATQTGLYNGYVARDGQAAADSYSARPGRSEHQTGLVIDLDDRGSCYLAPCFGQTPAGVWLAANAADYGFIVRYPEGKQDITGFIAEPWHFRYVGVELATEMQGTGTVTLEEFFGLPAAPGYAG
jgi:D-alanyl-D-alanine carboxypeptidase